MNAVLMFLLSILNILQNFFWCFYYWLYTVKCLLGSDSISKVKLNLQSFSKANTTEKLNFIAMAFIRYGVFIVNFEYISLLVLHFLLLTLNM